MWVAAEAKLLCPGWGGGASDPHSFVDIFLFGVGAQKYEHFLVSGVGDRA